MEVAKIQAAASLQVKIYMKEGDVLLPSRIPPPHPPLDAKDKMVGQLAILYFSWVWQYGVMRFDNK